MKDRNERLSRAVEMAKELPKGLFFSVKVRPVPEQIELGIQAETQEEVEAVKKSLKLHEPWERRCYNENKRWKFITETEGIKVEIYACREAPPPCKAVKKTRTVTKRIPVEFEEREVEEEYLEWDCSG